MLDIQRAIQKSENLSDFVKSIDFQIFAKIYCTSVMQGKEEKAKRLLKKYQNKWGAYYE